MSLRLSIKQPLKLATSSLKRIDPSSTICRLGDRVRLHAEIVFSKRLIDVLRCKMGTRGSAAECILLLLLLHPLL